jgi:[1-hydroxy-2-(trimethylamino)ethyl]phosphonate dioxygenase
MSLAADIIASSRARGAQGYYGEPVSMTEHGLQAAHFAQAAGAAPPLVLAALLHDIGHLLEAVPELIEDWRVDAHHERLGARWLARAFGDEICEPVRLHVPAKRYLCATDAGYFEHLSAASVHTLKLQGGPMAAHELAQFERERYWREAVQVRQWDDQGKVAGLVTAPLEAYAQLIERLAR